MIRNHIYLFIALLSVIAIVPLSYSQTLEQVCDLIDNTNTKYDYGYKNNIFNKLEKDINHNINGENVIISFKLNEKFAHTCQLKVYGSLVVTELKRAYPKHSKYIDYISNNQDFSSSLLSAVFDELSRRTDFVEYGKFLNNNFSENIIKAAIEQQVRKFLDDPYSSYFLPIRYFGRLTTIEKFDSELASKLSNIDFLMPIPSAKKYASYLTIDDALVTLVILRNLGYEFKKDELNWLNVLLNTDFTRFDEEESFYGNKSNAEKNLGLFIDRLMHEPRIKNNEIPIFWEA